MEYGDEPHAPPAGVFADDVNFDGVAVSEDGVDWYEIQDLRSLRSDRFTDYDVDLTEVTAGLGLSFNSAFRIRFCQYDNNPAPKDGIFIQGIALTGDMRLAILHLAMDDNAASPTVADAAAGAHDQTFSDASGDPNTDAHTAPGQVGTALSFDGVDDHITLTPGSYRHVLAADQDSSICLWWKTNAPDPGSLFHFLSNYSSAESSMYAYTSGGDLKLSLRFVPVAIRWVIANWPGGADDEWHHYAVTRRQTVISIYRDGVLAVGSDHAENTLALAPSAGELSIGSNSFGGQASPGFADYFRVYDRALFESEVLELYNLHV